MGAARHGRFPRAPPVPHLLFRGSGFLAASQGRGVSFRHLAFPTAVGRVILASYHLGGSAAVIWAATVNRPRVGFWFPVGGGGGVSAARVHTARTPGVSGLASFLSGTAAPSCVPASSRCQLRGRGISSYKCPFLDSAFPHMLWFQC